MRKSRLSPALWLESVMAVAGCQGGTPSDMGSSAESSADSSAEATSQKMNGSLFSFELGQDGYVRAANLGVVVNDTAAEVTAEDAAGGFLWWLWLLLLLVVLVIWFVLWRYRQSHEA